MLRTTVRRPLDTKRRIVLTIADGAMPMFCTCLIHLSSKVTQLSRVLSQLQKYILGACDAEAQSWVDQRAVNYAYGW
ncbi:hypothetical protein FOXB_01561 [Fusarium oxysporum f. sp. conglutinans Fo5176]|uniref:Uncharacterized protein n=1 Tax=Fusarium oxysporum (strain Fo5176) TaxID=660025 RepID=F9F586_FUSOF|nr:hypothetical protein FOXB_01561 [Fusarium oxysporum f. sp. conglutinans Fo5176]